MTGKFIYHRLLSVSPLPYFLIRFRGRFEDICAEMYSQSDDLQNHFSGINDHQMANLAQEKRNEAVKLDYSEDAKAIVDDLEKGTRKVWNICILLFFGASGTALTSWLVLDNTAIELISVSVAFLSLCAFPLWKRLIEKDQAVHEAINKMIVYEYGHVYPRKRREKLNFARLYWNSCLKYKAGLIGLIALAVLDLVHYRILGVNSEIH